jgi:hypothetical protein
MRAREPNSFRRMSCSATFIVAVLGSLIAVAAGADAFEEAFPAPHWQRAKSATKYAAECVSKICGRPAHVLYQFGPSNPTIADNIKSGAINRDWAEKLAVSFRKSQGDKVTVLDFEVQTGQAPGWLMVYECHCDGATNYIASQVVSVDKGSMTFFSSARTAAASRENLNKMVGVVYGPSYTGSTSSR